MTRLSAPTKALTAVRGVATEDRGAPTSAEERVQAAGGVRARAAQLMRGTEGMMRVFDEARERGDFSDPDTL